MFKGFIDWHGPIQYIVHWWGVHISIPFQGIFVWLAGLIHVPSPPEWVADYLALGFLLFLSDVRARKLLPSQLVRDMNNELARWANMRARWAEATGLPPIEEEMPLHERRWRGLLYQLRWLWRGFVTVIAWPVVILRTFPNVYSKWKLGFFGRRLFEEAVSSAFLILAPFALFLLLWGLNFLMELRVIPGNDITPG